jgi:hypothetical protein
MLAADQDKAAAASVLVKVMQVPRDAEVGAGDGFDTLVSRIVANTNWQNAINYADLVSNDRVQIEVERALRKVGYVYLRKRQKKSEARKLAGKMYFIIKKEELAQAVAACEMDPVTVREGKNRLFGDHYKTVFPTTDANFYLTRFWARRHVGLASRGKPQWGYAGWMTLHFLWSCLAPVLKYEEVSRRFWSMSATKDAALCTPLGKGIDIIFDQMMEYYNLNKGTGDAVMDPSTFFRGKRGRHIEFEGLWKTRAAKKDKFDAVWAKVQHALVTSPGSNASATSG